MAAHRFVDIHSVTAWGIKAGQPHITHYHQLQRVVHILEAGFQPFFSPFVVDMRLQHCLIRCCTGHHDFDLPFFRIVIVPLRTQRNNFIVKMDADFTAHGDNHRLAVHYGIALLKVRNQIGSDLLKTWFSTN